MNAIVQTDNLVPVIEHEIDGELQPCVDARTLHGWLKNGDRFATWIKKRLSTYGFVENQDYVIVSEVTETIRTYGKNQRKGRSVKKEFILTLGAAKELSMVENNEQGRVARRYFINCEKALNQASKSIQLEIGRAIQYFDQFNASLSNAARFLSVGGKQTKPRLWSDLEKLIQKAQPQLPFNEKKDDCDNDKDGVA